MVSVLVSCKISLSLSALVSSRGTIFRRVNSGVENAPSTKGGPRGVNAKEEGESGRYANFVGEPAIIEHWSVHRVFRGRAGG